MLIRSNINTPLNLLESIQYIEPVNSPAMVPIVENTTIGANVVALEDIMKFSESNGIEDLGYALSMVCEANGINKSTIVFSVQEENLIAYQQYSDIVQNILSENVDVFVSPISRQSKVFSFAEAAVSYLETYGDESLLEAFVDLDILTEAEDKIPDSAEFIGEKDGTKYFIDRKSNQWYAQELKKTDSWLVKLKKNAVDKPRDWIAKQIAALNQKMRDFIAKAEQADPKAKTIFMKIKEKIARAIEWLTRKLANAVRREKDTVTAKIEPLNQR